MLFAGKISKLHPIRYYHIQLGRDRHEARRQGLKSGSKQLLTSRFFDRIRIWTKSIGDFWAVFLICCSYLATRFKSWVNQMLRSNTKINQVLKNNDLIRKRNILSSWKTPLRGAVLAVFVDFHLVYLYQHYLRDYHHPITKVGHYQFYDFL